MTEVSDRSVRGEEMPLSFTLYTLIFFAQGFEVSFVLCAPGQLLVSNQGFAADEIDSGYSTPFELSNSINWRQSSGSGIPLLVRHSPTLEQNLQPLRRRKLLVVGARGRFRLLESSILGDHRRHPFIVSPGALSRNRNQKKVPGARFQVSGQGVPGVPTNSPRTTDN